MLNPTFGDELRLDAASQSQAATAAMDGTDVSTPDPQPVAFRSRFRIDTDTIETSQSQAGRAIFGDLGNAVGLRRVWLGAEGHFASGGRYVTVIDLASGNVVVRDVFVGMGDVQEQGELQAGHFLEPFSLEVSTPSVTLPFLEASVVSVLDPARSWGVSLFRSRPDSAFHFAMGLFHAGIDANDFIGRAGGTVGLTGRWTAAPINDDERLLHVGIALSERIPEDGLIVINQQPQSSLIGLQDIDSSPFIPSIRVPATFQQLANVQFAAARGSSWVQAEWYGTWIDQRSGGTVFFHGLHADWGYFITGERRPYRNGTFGPVQVNRPVFCRHCTGNREVGWGAWELTARFAYADFQDRDTPRGLNGEEIGIRLPVSTFGANWYLTDHLRLMFNYSYSLPQEPNTGTSVGNIFALRLGAFW